MDPFDSVLFAIVATGGILVIGGIYLVASGAIRLAGEQNDGTSFKVGAIFQISTTVPGLGIFLIGLTFDFAGLYYANQARIDNIPGQISAAVLKDSNSHALRLAGIVQTKNQQDVRLSVCMGRSLVVSSNSPFDEKIGPYLDFIVAKLDSAGAIPQQFTIYSSDALPPSFKNFTTLYQPKKDGLVDIGRIELNQVVDLSNAPSIHAGQALASIPAGSAYASGSQ